MNNPFNNQKLRDALFKGGCAHDIGIRGLVTMGSGPFEEEDFDDFLKGLEFQIYGPSEGIDVLIVGNSDWTETALQEILRLRAGKRLRVYSQEMFLAFLVSGADPLRDKYEVKMEYARNHGALEFLIEFCFNWPATNVLPARGGVGPLGWHKTSLLGVWGYKVGGLGLEAQARRKILVNAFRQSVPVEELADDYGDCGNNNSPQRLEKIADIIASLCRLNKKRHGNFKAAIEDYESDLEWLRQEVYLPAGFNFSWPETAVV